MNPGDIDRFTAVWRAAAEIGGNRLSDAAIAIAFRVLSEYSISQVERAIERHLSDPERGRYAIKPADVIEQIRGQSCDDGRPTADEAWALAVKSFDESASVVLNDEIGAALNVARVIYQDGDRVGARIAFRAAYERAVSDARANGRPVNWWPSLGQDPSGRRQAVEEAERMGRLPAGTSSGLLPAPDAEHSGMNRVHGTARTRHGSLASRYLDQALRILNGENAA